MRIGTKVLVKLGGLLLAGTYQGQTIAVYPFERAYQRPIVHLNLTGQEITVDKAQLIG